MRYFIGTLICSTILFAQTETLTIDAQNFEADDKKGISIFTGNVKIKMGQDRLNADKVDVYFTTDKDNKKVPLKYEATGKADFEIVTTDKHYFGNGDKVIYSPQKEEYTILGNGFLQEKNEDRKVYGDTIYVNQLSGEARVKGSEQKPVRFIINVERSDTKGKKLMRITEAKFLQSAQGIADSPSPDRAEVAFLGRSNVGKSSLLNTLTNRKGLAKSSSTPGKTQLINYFEINFKTDNEELPYLYARFVDLPGFGYAKVAKSIKAEWNRNLTAYLEQRPCLQIFVHLIDSRHPLLDIDKNVDEFLRTIKRGDQIIIQAFTKIDKLKMNDLAKLKREYPDGIFISNLKKKGMIDLQNKITGYLFGH